MTTAATSRVVQSHQLSCDILVAGGGPAGVPCALAAARNGAKVILAQDRPVLGGNASSEIRMHIVGADQHGTRGKGAANVETREGGIIEEIRLECALKNPQRSAHMLDLILYDLCRNEPNLTLMLNTAVTGAAVSDGAITHAIAERPSTDDRFTIAAKIFIDCTGDGRLGAEAGADFHIGREAHETHGETLARDIADRKTLGSSLMFTAREYPQPMPFVAPSWTRPFEPSDFKHRPIGGLEYGYWWSEWGGQLDTIKDNEAIRDHLIAIVMGIWDYIKNGPDEKQRERSKNWALDWIGMVPGKRESRRFIGQTILTEKDVLSGNVQPDAIAYGGWHIDIHPPEGVGRPEEPPFVPNPVPQIYDIPLRACVSRNISNLMFAGRNISASHVAFASTRVMATCAAVGQGVGTAAAYALRHQTRPAALAGDPRAVGAIQQMLLRDDCFLIGHRNDDADDRIRAATITASDHQSDGEPTLITTGQTRDVSGEHGAPEGRKDEAGQSHRWKSRALPAWIEARWDKPVTIETLQIIFDTGLNRQLGLSMSDWSTNHRQIYGKAQPETVADYSIALFIDGTWRTAANVTGNYQRLRRHALSARNVSAVRIAITKTNGLDHARIMELRAYPSPPQ